MFVFRVYFFFVMLSYSRFRLYTSCSSQTAVHGGFGVGGLAFQLGFDGRDSDDLTDDEDVDHDLLTVSTYSQFLPSKGGRTCDTRM